MSRKTNEFKVGLFVVCGVAILLGGLVVFGASKFFEGKTLEETYVDGTVEGLKVGAPVLLRGVPVGEVTSITFSWNVYHVPEPRYVVVVFEVGEQVALVPPGPGYAERVQQEVAKGLRARIKSQGLAGATILSLEYVENPAEHPPLPVPWKPRHIYIPSAPGQFSQIVASLGKIASSLREIDFAKLGAQVQQDLVTADRMLDHFNQVDVAGLGTNLNSLVSTLRNVSARLEAFVGTTNQLAQANLPVLSAEAAQLLEQLRETTGKLDRIAGGPNASSLNESLANIRRASRELEQALHQFKEYPAGTLFGRPPPPAKSVERARD